MTTDSNATRVRLRVLLDRARELEDAVTCEDIATLSPAFAASVEACKVFQAAVRGEPMTAPTDAETIAALAAQLDTTPGDLTRYAAESVRAPTETPCLCDECGKTAEDATETCSCGLEVCEACLDRKHYQCNEQVQS